MADKNRMLEAIRKFEFHSSPSKTNGDAPCTVADLERVIKNLGKVLKVIVEEIDKQ